MNEKVKTILEIIGVIFLILSFIFTIGYFWCVIGSLVGVPLWFITISLFPVLVTALFLAIFIIMNLIKEQRK